MLFPSSLRSFLLAFESSTRDFDSSTRDFDGSLLSFNAKSSAEVLLLLGGLALSNDSTKFWPALVTSECRDLEFSENVVF